MYFRVLGRVTEGLPQFLDGGIDGVVELHHRVVRPEFLADFFPRRHLAPTLHEHQQNLKGLLLQHDLAFPPAQFTGAKVEFKGSKADAAWKDGSHEHSE
jgi:hypothetical protein